MDFKLGDILTGEVIDFTHEGNGVIKIDNFTFFTSEGLVGDRVKFRIDKLKKNYGNGTVTEIIQPSKDRVDLDFELTESKGGIPLIQYAYEKQLEWKKEKVRKDLEKIAGIRQVEIKDTLGMDFPYKYRNHVQIPVGEKDGKIVIGFYKANSNEIIDMEKTILIPDIGNRVIQIIRQWMEDFNIRPYNRRSRKGFLRHIGLRINKDDEIMVILVTGNKNIPRIRELIERLKGANVVSLYENINKLNSSVTYGRQYKKLYGKDTLIDYIGHYKFNISPNSFFQVNRTQTDKLYSKAIEYLDLKKDDIVYDLYCGIGTISLFVAERAKRVYGIEIVKEAIEDARKNAELNDIHNAEFIVGKTEEVFPKMTREGIKANKLVLDPPRKGCEREALEAIVDLGPERVVYVSCNPSTMARDVKYLVEKGYRVVEVQPVDMFPHTVHVECVVEIQKV
ncbi:MAG: 23S rRNA (uracil(1939)-C(5))-methyltransferase RlmD [Tissierellia bacterium]|nr:23S rRNA (uracil(1939)-C(5))-methyltransferase RlmD [Tissierellia bacterium]